MWERAFVVSGGFDFVSRGDDLLDMTMFRNVAHWVYSRGVAGCVLCARCLQAASLAQDLAAAKEGMEAAMAEAQRQRQAHMCVKGPCNP